MRRAFLFGTILLTVALFAGCAGVPIRQEVKVDKNLPLGKIEGQQFVGIRYPFKVSAPPGWKVTTEYPPFMIDLGYEKEGLEASQVFIYNPTTQSNLQIDFEPADRYSQFSQKGIENLTTAAMGSFQEELQKDYGKDIKPAIAPTEPYALKGVPYAAKKYATYTLKGVKREQGWVYAFAEPYQIFILYLILNGAPDRQAIKQILDSFEYLPPGK